MNRNSETEKATISISDESLRQVKAEDYFSLRFSVMGLGSGDTVVRWEVKRDEIEYNDGIEITEQPPRIFNRYIEPFPIQMGNIKYREGLNMVSVDKWEDVPNGRGVDMFNWVAPNPLLKQYKYYITAYIKEAPETGDGGGSSRNITTNYTYTINKTFVQTVYGTWTEWQNILKRKIKERGRWRD